MSQELVKRNGNDLPVPAEISRELEALKERGDADTLLEVSRQAAVHQEYEKRQNAKARADAYGRIKVMAEAQIGLLDIEMHPTTRHGRLVIRGEEPDPHDRNYWRVLGTGQLTGHLEDVILTIERGDQQVITFAVVQELRGLGIYWLDVEPLRSRFQQLKKREGLTLEAVAQKTGLGESTVRRCLTRKQPGNIQRAQHTVAVRVAEAMGVDPSSLKPRPRRKKRPVRQMPRQRKLPGGRLDQTYVLIRKALQELDGAAGTEGKWGTGEAYEHLYQAEEIVGKAMKRAVG